jgi:hypothetical protein
MLGNKPEKNKRKKSSRGDRTHVRRMKQEARKGPVLDGRPNKKTRKVEIATKAVTPVVE